MKSYPEDVVRRAYKNVFNSMAGKIVLGDLQEKSGYGSTVFNVYEERIDPLKAAFFDGMRAMFIQIKEAVEEEENGPEE